jgi:hypothetical protein
MQGGVMCTRLGQTDNSRSTSGQRLADDSKVERTRKHKGQEGKQGHEETKKGQTEVRTQFVRRRGRALGLPSDFVAKAGLNPLSPHSGSGVIGSRRGCVRALVERRSWLSVA